MTNSAQTYQLNPPSVNLYCEKLMLSLLFQQGLFSKLFSRNNWDDDIALPLGLPEELEDNHNMRPISRQLLHARWKNISQQLEYKGAHELAEHNLAFIQQYFHLSEAEADLLRFAVYLHSNNPLRELLYKLRRMNFLGICNVLSSLLNLSVQAVREALGRKGKLFTYGFLSYRSLRSHGEQVEDYLEWGNLVSVDELLTHPLTETDLLKNCTSAARTATLQWSDFDHIAALRQTAQSYLQQAVNDRRRGVNILLHGQPGTGKTEFSILLAAQLGLSAHSLTSQDEDGDAIDGAERLICFRVAQNLLEGSQSVLIFDEIEGIFSGGPFQRSVADQNKAWINDCLENNPIPTVWISNNVHCMDSAAIRRFDLVIEMPDLPQTHKAKLLQQASKGRLNAQYVAHLSRQTQLLPAVIERGLKVANSVCSDQADFNQTAVQILNQTLQAQGHKPIAKLPPPQAAYSLQWVNTHIDLEAVSQGLAERKQGRICCYGAPGTGKTAWANWVAESAGLQVLSCKGSDLLGRYVGETEQNIARAFRRASDENLVLIIDEADSFLYTRSDSQQTWERNLVNEMLTQIEQFDGLLIISTNLMDDFDPAVLRRFDLKIKFDWLTPIQTASLASEQLQLLALPALSDRQKMHLQTLKQLAPGDFNAVARRHRFAPFSDAAEWLAALTEECRLKHTESAKIGFC